MLLLKFGLPLLSHIFLSPTFLCVATASVTLCYSPVSVMPSCKKVEFTVNREALTQRDWAKVDSPCCNMKSVMSMWILLLVSHKLCMCVCVCV